MSAESKLFQLLKCLSDIEIKRFRNVIKKNHSEDRVSILELLIKGAKNNSEEPEKEWVFTKVFKEKYSKEKDYIIRNEYRLICDELESFLAQCPADFASEIRLKLNYLNRLLVAGNYHLFLIEKQNTLKSFPAHPYLFADLLAMEADYIARFKLINPNAIGDYVEFLKNYEGNMGALNKYYASEIDLRKHFAERVYRTYAIEGLVDLNSALIDDEHIFAFDIQYNKLKSKQFLQFGTERIETLQEMEVLLPKCVLNLEKEKFFPAASIPLEWLVIGEYKESIKAYERAVKLPGFESCSTFISGALFNYLSALNKAGEYDKFESVYQKYSDLIPKTPYPFRLALLRGVVNLHLNNFRKARSVVRDEVLEDKSSDYFYMKLLGICCSLGEGNLISAQNDLDNYNRLIKFNNASTNYQLAANILKYAIRWNSNPTEKNLERLHSSIKEAKNDPLRPHHDLSPIRWIATWAKYVD